MMRKYAVGTLEESEQQVRKEWQLHNGLSHPPP